jgi:HupE/UreJ protein
MIRKLALVLTMVSCAVAARAHPLDEYVQATLISLETGRVDVSMRLVPGAAVFDEVMRAVDTDANGAVSAEEGRRYAKRVLSELTLSIDGTPLTPRVVSVGVPPVELLREGMEAMRIELTAPLPEGSARRRLVLENHHFSRISAYLVNCLVPRDSRLKVQAQHRSSDQASYELDYLQSAISSAPAVSQLPAEAGGFASLFRLGMRHIAEGTDHLLFLLALLLPAPLLVIGGRWGASAGWRQSLFKILRVVTAFTVGHSITLAFGAWGVMSFASGAIELLIAVSILVAAVHAMRPLFAGREAFIAAFFGLIHGLAFATVVAHLDVGPWQRVASLLGFNLGIEAMQLVVIAAALPSLLLISRTRAYAWVRVSAALFTALASIGWIAERSIDEKNLLVAIVEAIAEHPWWIFCGLSLLALVGVVLRPVDAGSARA